MTRPRQKPDRLTDKQTEAIRRYLSEALVAGRAYPTAAKLTRSLGLEMSMCGIVAEEANYIAQRLAVERIPTTNL